MACFLKGARKVALTGCAVAVAIIAAACGSSGAPDPQEVRKLASGSDAQTARDQVEQELRLIIDSYSRETALNLALLVVEDRCVPGSATEWFFPSGRDQYTVKCTMHVQAYFGVPSDQIGDSLESVVEASAFDRTIPFGSDEFRRDVIAFYRGEGPNPLGAHAKDPTSFVDSTQRLSWDSQKHGIRVQELKPTLENDPPLTRTSFEPAIQSVQLIRERHGVVFHLDLARRVYFVV